MYVPVTITSYTKPAKVLCNFEPATGGWSRFCKFEDYYLQAISILIMVAQMGGKEISSN